MKRFILFNNNIIGYKLNDEIVFYDKVFEEAYKEGFLVLIEYKNHLLAFYDLKFDG